MITDKQSTETAFKPDERVGVLLVHGIGEQRQFEHLVEVARNIALALKADSEGGALQVQLAVRTSPYASFAAQQETWSFEGGKAPVTVNVKNLLGYVTEINFHEVWWADLGEPTTLPTTIAFWSWGLSLWADPGYLTNTDLDLHNKEMRYPGPSRDADSKQTVSPGARLRLFGTSMLVLLIMPILFVVNRLLFAVTGNTIRLDIIAQYISRVKLFQQAIRNSKGPLIDFDQPPRVTIRRRMVLKLIDMALQKYDRWYILAHSQGTVLALNGLMEIEQALPNYLNEEVWSKIKKDLGKIGSKPVSGATRPHRPFWLCLEDTINREKLFSGLYGLITYGSPLSKFSVLWPASVRINKNHAFSKEFEWINIYDPTDPVAGRTEEIFNLLDSLDNNLQLPAPNNGKEAINKCPRDIAYKAPLFHLLSHITYLNFEKGKSNRLINRIASWLLRGEKFQSPKSIRKNWIWAWSAARITTWWILCGLVASLVGISIEFVTWFFDQFFNVCLPPDPLQWIAAQFFTDGKLSKLSKWIVAPPYNSWLYIFWAIIIIFVAGAIKIIQRFWSRRSLISAKATVKNYFQQNLNNRFEYSYIISKFKEYFQERKINEALTALAINERIICRDRNCQYVLPTLKLSFSKFIDKNSITRIQRERLCKSFERICCQILEQRDEESKSPEDYYDSAGNPLFFSSLKIEGPEDELENLIVDYFLEQEKQPDSELEVVILRIA